MKVFSFAIGDVVLFKKKKKETIISDTSFDDGRMQYGDTENGAWNDQEDYTLVRRADEKSLKDLAALEADEFDEGEE